MKILQISFHTSPFGSVGKFDSGGLNIYVQQTAKLLSNKHNVTVVTAEKAESFKENNLEFVSLNLFEKDLSVEDKEIYLQDFRKKLDEIVDLKSFDIIHAHYWLSGLVAKQIAEEFKIPLIYTSHSLGIFLEGYNNERVDCEKIVMTESDFVTASSEFENVLISENYKIDKNKIKHIPPGVDREIFSINPSIKRENIFLSIGRIQPQKGQLEVLNFLNNFRKIESNFKCYFIGGPSGKSGDEYLEELRKSIKEADLGSHVEFLDSLPQTKIKELLNRSKLLLHTSKFETFGLVAIEANSMGVPVLTTNKGSLVEIIENNKNGFLSENLVESSVNNFVMDLLQDDSRFELIMKNCIEKSSKYDWQNTTNTIEKLYKVLA
ncbi:MAG: glycosyltransferase [Candidatus Actinomarina sp.]|uniref:Glycosyltransferase n=1 Tax=Candidatus Actinomarina minuta TaxID=1389454 RepID=S5DRQ9_9ACTN|nr:glycosyltransferase [Candidatus Actinomarina minuta]|tara:strand:- start:2419 stop:3552 length:1134 start_codon:yes stop_codon:yes gene_type:complete